MSDLVDFLRARLDEDEAIARAAIDPARVLREVEAKRRIVWLYEGGDAYECSVMEPAIKAMAAIYSDHPDYRDEWKP